LDKFGIFKLLNSFFSFYSNAQKENSNSDKKENLAPLTNILSSLETKNTPPKEKPLPPAPLQAQMLSTMRSHDDFVKRVKNNNKI
jgi:hypothetical protein